MMLTCPALIDTAGQVKLMTTGASPISEEVFDFLRICFGATVLEGYGMTETSCVVTETQPGDATAGVSTVPPPGLHISAASARSHEGSLTDSGLVPGASLGRIRVL